MSAGERLDYNSLAENFGKEAATEKYMFDHPTNYDTQKNGVNFPLSDKQKLKGLDEKVSLEDLE